ncbi:hypothetical protein HK102_013360, partial [Quaeritorhiza haematococci]
MTGGVDRAGVRAFSVSNPGMGGGNGNGPSNFEGLDRKSTVMGAAAGAANGNGNNGVGGAGSGGANGVFPLVSARSFVDRDRGGGGGSGGANRNVVSSAGPHGSGGYSSGTT